MIITGTRIAQFIVVISLIVSLISHIQGFGNWFFTLITASFIPIVFETNNSKNNKFEKNSQ